LRVVALELRERVDVGLLVDDLQVADVTVSLSCEEEDVGVIVVEGHEDSRGRVNGGSDEWLGEISGIPDAVLSLRGLGGSTSEKLFLGSEPSQTRRLNAKMCLGFSSDGVVSGVDNSDLFVLGRGSQETSIVVPVDREDEVRMLSLDRELGLSLLNIPDLDGEITRRSGEKIVCNRVELGSADLSLVSVQSLDGLGEGRGQSSAGDMPDLGGTILRDGGNEVVVEGMEINVQDGRLVTGDERKLRVDLSSGS